MEQTTQEEFLKNEYGCPLVVVGFGGGGGRLGIVHFGCAFKSIFFK